MRHISRAEFLERLGEVEYCSEIKENLEYYLEQSIYDLDIEAVQLLLSADANPNPEKKGDCYLCHLLHEYRVAKTMKGIEIISLARCLLESGANPNRVWCNNWRAYDYTVGDRSVNEYSELLLEYGADPKIREKI